MKFPIKPPNPLEIDPSFLQENSWESFQASDDLVSSMTPACVPYTMDGYEERDFYYRKPFILLCASCPRGDVFSIRHRDDSTMYAEKGGRFSSEISSLDSLSLPRAKDATHVLVEIGSHGITMDTYIVASGKRHQLQLVFDINGNFGAISLPPHIVNRDAARRSSSVELKSYRYFVNRGVMKEVSPNLAFSFVPYIEDGIFHLEYQNSVIPLSEPVKLFIPEKIPQPTFINFNWRDLLAEQNELSLFSWYHDMKNWYEKLKQQINTMGFTGLFEHPSKPVHFVD